MKYRINILLLILVLALLRSERSANLQKNEPEKHNTVIDKIAFIPPQFHHGEMAKRNFQTDEEKIKYGFVIEDRPIPEPDKPIEEFYQNETIMRNLEETGTKLDKSGFFDFSQSNNEKKKLYAYKYVMTNLKKSASKFIVYPFQFIYADESSQNHQYDQGGVFTLRPELLPPSGAYNYFEYLSNTTNAILGKSKALYDINIAIFKIEDEIDGYPLDLFYDSDSYCSFFVTYLGKNPSCLYGKKEFITYRNNNPSKGATVLYNHTELLDNGLFDDDGNNAFGLVIFPDHVAGSEDKILKLFKQTGIDMFKKFVSQGGQILATGKSGYLLEKMGILQDGSYDTSKFLLSKESDSVAKTKGCEGAVGKAVDESTDFFHQLLCMNNEGKTYLTTTYPMKTYTGFEKIMSIDVTSTGLTYKSDEGNDVPLEADAQDFPYALVKQEGKGRIYIVNGNPLFKSSFRSIMFNVVFSAMTKNMIFNSYINFGEEGEDLPIPGGEAGILVEAVIEFINLYNKPVNNFNLCLYLPVNVSFSNYDNSCHESTELIAEHENITSMNLRNHLECSLSVLNGFQSFKQVIKLEILDQGVTQKATDIPLMYPIIKYTEEETGLESILDDGAVKVEAALAAVLRGTLNPDPSSFYPLPGRGAFADSVLQVENKENTLAFDVDYISIIPLISPVVDGSDQGSPIELCELYEDYYSSHKYTFPWHTDGTDMDYIDYVELSGKSVVMVAEWDTPVKISKELRVDAFPDKSTEIIDTEIDVNNANQTTIIDNSQTVLKQLYFKSSNLFYELATQRTMAFIDTATEKGAKAHYKNGIPTDLIDPVYTTRTKKNIPWSRVDIFFYPAEEYQQPTGIDYTYLLSLDHYEKPQPGTSEVYGKEQCGVHKKGYFDSSKSPMLVPNEYENLMLKYKFHVQYDPTKEEDMNKLKQVTNGEISLTHYLMPVKDKTVTQADNIMGFELTEGKNGKLKEYPSVEFVYGHRVLVVVDPAQSRQGGKLIIHLQTARFESTDPVKDELITVSADQVAFYETTYDSSSNTVTMFFKRGLMSNEAYGKASNLEIDFEKIRVQSNFTVKIELHEMKFDVTNKEAGYQTYKKIVDFPESYEAEYMPFYRLPAVVVHNHMNRNGNTTIREYELLAPYTRYGIYFQELIKHRTVWASPEAHHVTDPGLQAINDGFATISNIGISSIPYVEYVTHGKALLIPAAVSTSRLEWTDIWGRRWSQPLRSLFPDIPPVPPPLRNFMMSTTFELLSKDGSERFLEWPSDEEAVIRVQMKFVNNYPKFFLPTTCKENNIPFMKTRETSERDVVFFDPPGFERCELQGSIYHVYFGHSSVYGKCYQTSGAYLSGREITTDISNKMTEAMLCAATNDGEKIKNCVEKLKQEQLPLLVRRSGTGTSTWNYSPLVESYYPSGYIKDNMWDLTHYDYDDNAMDKGYKYHMDNNLPSIDVGPAGNPAWTKPHNLVAFPIFKGFGYQMDYDSTFTIDKFKPYHGWWSDNLQNKDNTLLAGQKKSNDVSVGKSELLSADDWIDAKDLVNTLKPNLPQNRLKTVYTCLFNRHRVKYSVDQKIYSYPHNVYQNNVIPIYNELDIDAEEYTNFKCEGKYQYQYTPVNISDFDNRIETPTDRDYLYFGINLRGGAKENINVLMTLKPFEDRKYEGITKVQDGARFTYWNPANGPNSFLVVDNVVNTVESYRVDYEITSAVYPGTLNTFNSVAYQLHTISDPNEKERAYTMTTYTNSYGFGDSTVTVYVGGTRDSNCKLERKEETYIKIAFYNNAGFDWNMRADAIDFEEKGTMAINGYDLLTGAVHTIQKPTSYNFLKLKIPDEIKEHIEIIPSDHNIDVAPQFFDFQNINVVTIRDSFEGDYFYKLTVKDTFPEKYEGKFWEIGVDIDSTMFDNLPGPNDPTGIHDYTLKIPPIKFAVKYTKDPYKGKVFYTLGRGADLKVQYRIYNTFKTEDVKLIPNEKIAALSLASRDSETANQELLNVWNGIDQSQNMPFEETEIENTNYKLVSVDVSKFYKTLPLEVEGQPDITEFSILSKAKANQIPFGYQAIVQKAQVEFTTPRKNQKISKISEPSNRYASVSGAWISVSFNQKVLELDSNGNYVVSADQNIYPTDSGVMKVNLIAKNVGSKTAYNTEFSLVISPTIIVQTDKIATKYTVTANNEGDQVITLHTNRDIPVGEKYAESLYIEYQPLSTLRNLGDSRTLIKKVSISIHQDANDVDNSSLVEQSLSVNYKINYRTTVRPSVELNIVPQGTFTQPKYQISVSPLSTALSEGNELISFYKKVQTQYALGSYEMLQDKIANKVIIDSPLTEEQTASLSEYQIFYRVEVYDKNQNYIESAVYQIKETLKDETEEEKVIENDKKKFPIWAIIIIVLLGLLLVSLVGYGIYRYITHKNAVTQPTVFKEIERERIDISGEKPKMSDPKTGRSSAPIIKAEEIKVNRYIPNPIIEMSEY